MQEDFNIFLLIGPIEAPYVPAANLVHGVEPPPSVLVLMAPFPSCSNNIVQKNSELPNDFAATLLYTIIKHSSSICCIGSGVSCLLTCLHSVLTCVFFLHSSPVCPNILQWLHLVGFHSYSTICLTTTLCSLMNLIKSRKVSSTWILISSLAYLSICLSL